MILFRFKSVEIFRIHNQFIEEKLKTAPNFKPLFKNLENQNFVIKYYIVGAL